MPRLGRISIALAAVALVFAGSASGGPAAHSAARTCHLTYHEQTHLGTTYVLSIRVRVTKCRDAKRVVKAFHACRPGKSGRCHHRVLGYSCSEKRFNKSRLSYDSKVRCSKGSRRVWHTYTQNL